MFSASIVAVAACGARTGLPPGEADTSSGGAPPALDAGRDAPVIDTADGGPDAFDAPPDVFDAPTDVFDAPTDVFDAPPDAIPDAAPDVTVDDCQDAGVTYIYLIGNDNQLIRFDPSTLLPTTIGTISCPIANPMAAPTPYSMAVDRQGIASVVFTDGELFRVSTATASCEATGFQIGQGGFSAQFGMGYSSDTGDTGETLFVVGNVSMELATLDPATLLIKPVGTFSSPIGEAELTGTGSGELYAFGLVVENHMTSALHLAQIDKPTAQVIADVFVTVQSGSAQIFDWAFAYWGGDFYFFTSSDNASTIVSRYHPGGPLALPVVATIGSAIVGAGVSTCAPHP